MRPFGARGRAVGGLAIALLAVGAVIAWLFPLRQSTPMDQQPPSTKQPDQGLRHTFDSLSPTAHRARLELLLGNVEAWAARWRLVAEARATIDIDYFIFSQDVFGRALLGHLVEKARQGVRVRLQVDAQGLLMSKQPDEYDCLPLLARTTNASVHLHRRLRDRIVEALVRIEPTLATASDHDKLIVVDGRFSLIGGRNIEAKYFAHPDDLPDAFHDADTILESVGVGKAMTEVFERTYESEGVTPLRPQVGDGDTRCSTALRVAYEAMEAWLQDRPLDPAASRPLEGTETSVASELAQYPRLKGALADADDRTRVDAEVHVLDSVPRAGSAGDAVTRGLARLFAATSRQILMESPYLVLTESAARMLEAADQRGVAMTLLTNSPRSTDNGLSQIYFREQWPRLLAATPSMRLFVGGTTHNIHSKLGVYDDQVVLIGSYNLDPFSMLISGEIMVAVWSREFAAQVSARTTAMIERGAPEVYQYAIQRGADGEPLRNRRGDPLIEFGPANHTTAGQGPIRGFRWALLRAVPWLAGLPPFF